MPLGVVSGFTPYLVTTTAASLIGGTGNTRGYVTARLTNATTSCTLRVYNHNVATPSASALIAKLQVAGRGADELSVPIRYDVGVVVKMSVNTGSAFVFIR